MRRLVAVLVILCFGGCSSTATIVRTDAPDNEAEIVSSDAGTLYVRGHNGRIYGINRASVSDIDHPGNVEILVGSILLGILAIGLAESHDSTSRDDLALISALYAGPGLSLLISGLVHYVPSVQAARAFESAEVPVRPLAPLAYPPPPMTLPPPPAVAPPPPPPEAPPPPPETEPQVTPNAT
jgi:hypothetical protein